ncbi:MAG: TonB-dependent receptor [Burkholderiaceae bacterium]|nr:TonB-dependent receptor [Burkholderiaceae bacterium]
MSSFSRPAAHSQALAVVSFTFLSSFTFLPQTSHAQSAPALESVVVTATRSETTIDRALADVVVIDSQAIRDAGAASLPELLRSAGGIEISQAGGRGTTSGLFLRGTKTSQTLILVDGVRIENPLSGSGMPEYLPLEVIERIEIVRGPMSSLYGSGAIGGVVQVFTRRAGADGWRPYASVGGGSQGTARAQAGFGAAQSGTRFSLSASAERSSGFNATRPSNPDYQPDRDGHRQRSLSASLSQRIAEGWELGANLMFDRGRADIDFACTSFSCPSDAESVQEFRTSAVTAYARTRPLTGWRSELRVGNTSIDYELPAFRFAPHTDSRTIAWDNEVDAWGGQARFGVERLEERIDGEGVTGGGFPIYAHEDRTTNSVFGGYERQFGEHTVRATARRDRIGTVGSDTTGALAWGWRFDPAWLVRASYGTAFRAPTFDDLYYLPPFGNPALRPEKSRGIDAALEYHAAATLLRATAFASRIEDAIELDSAFTPRNLSTARVRGLTLDARHPLGRWALRASVTVQHTEGERVDPVDGLVEISPLSRRAPRYGSIGIERHEEQWRVGAEAIGQSRRVDTQGARMGGYAVLGLWAGYAITRDWEIFARLSNAFDRDFETIAGYRSPPRSLYVELRYAMR